MQARKLKLSGSSFEVMRIEENPFFPISWLHKQEYCEYQIFLENVKGIKVAPTKAMLEGKQGHKQLYDAFKEKAVPATLGEMLVQSKTVQIFSREFRVVDAKHGVYGLIDEVLLTPEEFIVIDDKPGTRPFLSNIHQVYGYCLAFKEISKSQDSRRVMAALRERGTDNIYWTAPFDELAEYTILEIIRHIHAAISGSEGFSSANNPNKCKACRLKAYCERAST